MQTFATTHWSVVLAAGQTGQPGAAEALADLCGIYWFPLYAYVGNLSPEGNWLGVRSRGLLHLWRAPSWEEIATQEAERMR